ncbi:hypothetical protein D3C79_721190 [compost metagenome]
MSNDRIRLLLGEGVDLALRDLRAWDRDGRVSDDQFVSYRLLEDRHEQPDHALAADRRSPLDVVHDLAKPDRGDRVDGQFSQVRYPVHLQRGPIVLPGTLYDLQAIEPILRIIEEDRRGLLLHHHAAGIGKQLGVLLCRQSAELIQALYLST